MKFAKKFKQKYTKAMHNMSESTKKSLLLKDYGAKAIKHGHFIEVSFEYYHNNYIKCLEALHDDFNVKNIKGEDVAEAIDILNEEYNKYKKKTSLNVNPKVMFILLNKWRLVNTYFEGFEDVLPLIKKKAKTDTYGDIDFKSLETRLKIEQDLLREDFSFFIKEVSEK